MNESFSQSVFPPELEIFFAIVSLAADPLAVMESPEMICQKSVKTIKYFYFSINIGTKYQKSKITKSRISRSFVRK